MKIGVAQIRPDKGALYQNAVIHKKLIELAARHHADAIFFPELSLTGYEPELARQLATDAGDPFFDPFQQLSNQHELIIGLGMPTHDETGILISMILLQPNKPVHVYSKIHLHEDEFPYFVNGRKELLIRTHRHILSPAICYESLLPEHAALMVEKGADVYIASVAKSKSGIEKAYRHYPAIAAKYKMPVLMSNCVGLCDNFESAGNSAIWDASGTLIGKLDHQQEGILIFDTGSGELIKAVI